jgi:hypothetical protein
MNDSDEIFGCHILLGIFAVPVVINISPVMLHKGLPSIGERGRDDCLELIIVDM